MAELAENLVSRNEIGTIPRIKFCILQNKVNMVWLASENNSITLKDSMLVIAGRCLFDQD